MISLDEALRQVLERVPQLAPVRMPLHEAASAWLVDPVTSDVDLPPADVSAMDGFAVRAEDTATDVADLRVVGEIQAGSDPCFEIGPGQAARIMTGAKLPAGADSVQMVERTRERSGGKQVEVQGPVERGMHVRRRGENIRRGDGLLAAGQRVGPSEVGLLASGGITELLVRRRPRVALLPTGDELVEPDVTPGPAQIRNSNGPALEALLRSEGAEVDYLGIVGDEPEALRARIAEGLGRDVLLVTGGVSMGLYDLATEALREAGVEIVFEKIAIKPGKPAVFGVRRTDSGTTLAFGLPGNPVSCMVLFRLLVAPALRRMRGAKKVVDVRATASLVGSVPPTARREAFHPARVTWCETGLVAEPVRHHGSGDLVAWREANGMIRLPADSGADAGDRVEVLLDRDHDLR